MYHTGYSVIGIWGGRLTKLVLSCLASDSMSGGAGSMLCTRSTSDSTSPFVHRAFFRLSGRGYGRGATCRSGSILHMRITCVQVGELEGRLAAAEAVSHELNEARKAITALQGKAAHDDARLQVTIC